MPSHANHRPAETPHPGDVNREDAGERDRRWRQLHSAMARAGLDAVIVGCDDRTAGTLRYLTGRPALADGPAALVITPDGPLALSEDRQPRPGRQRRAPAGWVLDHRRVDHLADGLLDTIRRLPGGARVGVVGLAPVLGRAAVTRLRQALPPQSLTDATGLFESVRAAKSPAELAATRQAAAILDGAFAEVLDRARVGIAPTALAAAFDAARRRLGALEGLLMTMVADAEGRVTRPTFGRPGDQPLERGDVLLLHCEVAGPSGHRAELGRMLSFGPAGGAVERVASAAAAGQAAAGSLLRAGVTAGGAHHGIVGAFQNRRLRAEGSSGHGIGLDAYERPRIGADLVGDAGGSLLAEGMVVAIHPLIRDHSTRTTGYLADTYVVGTAQGNRLSQHPLGIHTM